MCAAAVHRVLVLSDEPVVAALVGLLVEVAGRTPVFASPGESSTDALERLRPLSVVLVDVAMGASHSDLFFAAAAKWGIGIAVFGPEMHAHEIAEIASTRAVPWFTMPPTAGQLATALDIASGRALQERAADRRVKIEAVIASDGTRIFLDQRGHRWMVYDRRASSDRRRDGGGERGDGDGDGRSDGIAAIRVFVSDVGETRQCGLDDIEVRQASASALELQLGRATPARLS
jgi:CheY-like chemotaxis protein